MVGNFRAAATGISGRRASTERESSRRSGASLNLGLGTIRWQLGPRHRYEDLRSFGSTKGTAGKVWLRTQSGGYGYQAAIGQELTPRSVSTIGTFLEDAQL